MATLIGVVAAALDALGVVEISWIAAAIGWSVAAFAVLAVVTFLLFRWRSRVVERAMAKKFFSRSGKATKLSALPMPSAQPDSVPLHVFCATELQQGQQLYATPEFVYTYAYGLGVPGDMSLARAVQCSACLPGGFAPRFLRTAQHRFPKSDVPKRMVLSDGGVYDNMADQWETGRADRPLGDDGRFPAADELIVVNASAAATSLATKTRLLGAELFGLKRPIDVMYDITTKMRRFELVEDWNAAERSGTGQRGTLGAHPPVAVRRGRAPRPHRHARAAGPRQRGAAVDPRQQGGVGGDGGRQHRRQDDAREVGRRRRGAAAPPLVRAGDGELARRAGLSRCSSSPASRTWSASSATS